MSERFYTHVFPNGFVLVAQPMAGVKSAAFNLLLPAGATTEPADRLGLSTVLAELVFRGAGDRDSRGVTDHLDLLGLQRSASVGTYHTRFACAGVGPNVVQGISVYADLLRRPHLPADGFEAARDLSLQAIQGLTDDPRHYLLTLLNRHALPEPRGRNPMGDAEHLQKLTLADVKADHQRRYQANRTIFSIAGAIDVEQVKDEIARLFEDWTGQPQPAIPMGQVTPAVHHEMHDSEQTHIGISWPTVVETDPNYITARVAIEVLSGGTSGRLFTELREKRGLVYHASANYVAMKDSAAVMGYAGTSNDRAQKTLETYIEQLQLWARDITQDELNRAKIALKSATILSGESTSARAAAIANDYFILGRIRQLDEIKAAIDSVTLDGAHAFLRAHPPGPFTVVTVGPQPLTMPDVSST